MSTPFGGKKWVTLPLKGISVMIGMPVHRPIPPKTTLCLMQTVAHLVSRNVPWQPGMISAGNVVNGRDEVLEMFLKSDANRLFWVDSDMTWTMAQFMRLLALSVRYPVVAAAYPAKIDRPTFFITLAKDAKPDDLGLLEAYGLGLGFSVWQREVAEKLSEGKPLVLDEISGSTVHEVFRWDTSLNGGGIRTRRGEDMAVFNDIRELGYKVMLDPSIDLGHIGDKEYRGTIRDALEVQHA